MVGVVGLGEAGTEIAESFAPYCPVRVASSMDQAVDLAAAMAEPGDVVLLSPACASFDWYPHGGYPARGDEFKSLVTRLLAPGNSPRTDDAAERSPRTDDAAERRDR